MEKSQGQFPVGWKLAKFCLGRSEKGKERKRALKIFSLAPAH
jgi:hypothetical protein